MKVKDERKSSHSCAFYSFFLFINCGLRSCTQVALLQPKLLPGWGDRLMFEMIGLKWVM